MTTYIDPVDHTKLAKAKATWAAVLEQLSNLPCETPEHEAWWAARLAMAHTDVAELEAERQQLVRPLIDDKTRIDKLFKDAAAPAEAVKALVKSRLAAAAEERSRLQAAAREAARLAAQSGDAAGVTLALSEVPEDVKLSGASTTYAWAVESIDTEVLPDDYWVVDYAKLESLGTSLRGSETAPVVAGVKFKRVAWITARPKRSK